MNFMKCPINFGWAGQNVQFTFVQKGHWHALWYAPTRYVQVHHQLSLLKCEPSQEHVIVTSVNKCRTRIILTVGHVLFPNHLVLSASSWFLKYLLNFLSWMTIFKRTTIQGILASQTSEIQVVYKFSKGHSVTVKSWVWHFLLAVSR